MVLSLMKESEVITLVMATKKVCDICGKTMGNRFWSCETTDYLRPKYLEICIKCMKKVYKEDVTEDSGDN